MSLLFLFMVFYPVSFILLSFMDNPSVISDKIVLPQF